MGRAMAAVPALLLLILHASAAANIPASVLTPAGSRRAGGLLPFGRNLGLRGGIFSTTSQEKMKSASEAAVHVEAAVVEAAPSAKRSPTPTTVAVSFWPLRSTNA